MSTFVKYVLRGIKKSPTQQIIIIITLICSIITMMSSMKIVMSIQDELRNKRNGWYDIEVNLSSQNDVRVLFDDDAKRVVGDNGSVLGEFHISGLVDTGDGKELISLTATDVVSADEFRRFKFTDYGQITDRNLNKSIILSHDAVERYSLKIGDNISVYMLGRQFNFTVEAVAISDGILLDNVGVINIGAVTAALAEINPMISHVDSINPYSSLKIKLNDSAKIGEYKNAVSAIPSLRAATVITTEEKYQGDFFVSMTSIAVVSTTTMIILLLSAIVVASSFDILNKKRRKDRALFMICGASPNNLTLALIIELLIYGAIAVIISTTAAFPIYIALSNFYGYSDFANYPISLLISAITCTILVLAVALIESKAVRALSVSDLLSETESTDKHKLSGKSALIVAIVFAIGFLMALLAPIKQRFYIYIILCFLFFALIYLSLPFALNLISKIAIKAIGRLRRVPAILMIAFKNLYSSYSLMHATRLICIICTALSLILICLKTLNGQIDVVNNVVDCDYISLGADEKSAQEVEDMDGVDSAFYVSLSQNIITEANTALLSIAVSDEAFEFLNPAFKPTRSPRGNEIAISSGISNLCSKKAGDEITLIYESREYTFKIIDVIRTNANLVIYNSDYIVDNNSLLCIRTSESAGEEQIRNISNALEARGASIVKSETIFEFLTRRLTSYSKMVGVSVYIAVITTFLGIANALISSLLARKREREIYYAVGMTRADVFKTELTVILICITTALIFSMLLLPFALLLLDSSLISWGVDLI